MSSDDEENATAMSPKHSDDEEKEVNHSEDEGAVQKGSDDDAESEQKGSDDNAGSEQKSSSDSEESEQESDHEGRERKHSDDEEMEMKRSDDEETETKHSDEDEGMKHSDNESVQKDSDENEDSEQKDSADEGKEVMKHSDEEMEMKHSDDEEKKHKDSDDEERERNQSDDEEKELKPSDDEEREQRDSDDDDKGAEVEEPLPETRIDVDIPKITTDLGKSVHFVKLPNFLSVETRPFDPNTYEDEIDDEETLDEEGRARLKLKVENTIRWREKFNEKGVFVKESNARFVRWSDGSLSLHLGDEIFNVERQALHGDHNHLFIRQGTGLQGQAVFRTKLTFRPHSTESFTHRKMTMSLADRSTKAQGIKVLSTVGADPEAHRDVLIKKEEDKLKASVRRENKQRRVRERGSKGLSTSYLDDEYSDEDNSISIAAIKNRYKKGGSRAHIYSSDEDDGSDVEQGRRLEKAKRLKDSEEEDEGGDSGREGGKQSTRGGADGGSSGKQESPVQGPSSSLMASALDSD